jgi:cell fate (sporulation/competence/biofilm development) regulator YmcA (YheA/YmcA/DUF963 family)
MIKRDVQLLKKEILNSNIYKEYSSLKMQIETSQELKDLKRDINLLKQEMTKNINNSEAHALIKKQYLEKQNEYDNHPLIQNYNYIKEEFYQELNLVKEQINP